jgi:hypothetical protein
MLPLPPPTKTSRARRFPKKVMNPIRKHFKEGFLKNGVIFMTASGLELSLDGGLGSLTNSKIPLLPAL